MQYATTTRESLGQSYMLVLHQGQWRGRGRACLHLPGPLSVNRMSMYDRAPSYAFPHLRVRVVVLFLGLCNRELSRNMLHVLYYAEAIKIQCNPLY